ncbi:MAG: hypothetical protein R3F55_10685 [Alphaproteobacteria bacterium]
MRGRVDTGTSRPCTLPAVSANTITGAPSALNRASWSAIARFSSATGRSDSDAPYQPEISRSPCWSSLGAQLVDAGRHGAHSSTPSKPHWRTSERHWSMEIWALISGRSPLSQPMGAMPSLAIR